VPRLSRREFARLGWPGLIQPGLAFVLGILGLALTTASNDALIWASESVMVLGIAWLWFGRRPGRSLAVLAMTALAGVALATSNPTGEGTPISLGGNALILVAVGCGACYTLITEHQVRSHAPLVLLALHQLWGLGLVLLVWLGVVVVSGRSGFPATLSATWLVALGSGMLQFALPFLCFLIALEGLGAGRVSSFLTIPPIVTIVGARIFLGERLALVQLFGGAVVLLAVAAIQRLASAGEGEADR
jgi:drug/metabolite transporter (DMT)-like permease